VVPLLESGAALADAGRAQAFPQAGFIGKGMANPTIDGRRAPPSK
jgi:hypothetical protein